MDYFFSFDLERFFFTVPLSLFLYTATDRHRLQDEHGDSCHFPKVTDAFPIMYFKDQHIWTQINF